MKPTKNKQKMECPFSFCSNEDVRLFDGFNPASKELILKNNLLSA